MGITTYAQFANRVFRPYKPENTDTFGGIQFPLRSDLSVSGDEVHDCNKDGCHVQFNPTRGILGVWECRYCDNYVATQDRETVKKLGIAENYLHSKQRVFFNTPILPENTELKPIAPSCKHFFECDYQGTQTFKCNSCDYSPNVGDEEFLTMLEKANYIGMTIEEFQHMRNNNVLRSSRST